MSIPEERFDVVNPEAIYRLAAADHQRVQETVAALDDDNDQQADDNSDQQNADGEDKEDD